MTRFELIEKLGVMLDNKLDTRWYYGKTDEQLQYIYDLLIKDKEFKSNPEKKGK